jgi:plasmid stabilization system protein ParE
MAYRVRYLPKAVQQLDATLTYLAVRNPSAARDVGEAIHRA